MSANPSIQLTEVPIGGHDGALWNRLHAEREDISELMLKNYQPDSETTQLEGVTACNDVGTAAWHRELLQRRLQKIDDALDRLMSGSYGKCSRCSDSLDEVKLDLDPAIAFCSACWNREQSQMQTLNSNLHQSNLSRELGVPRSKTVSSVTEVALETVGQFDTIVISTRNSVYRALLLDPQTGRALVEGGDYLVEPKEAFLSGAILRGDTFKLGSILVGYRLELWVNGRMMLTSPVEALHIEHHPTSESLEDISTAN